MAEPVSTITREQHEEVIRTVQRLLPDRMWVLVTPAGRDTLAVMSNCSDADKGALLNAGLMSVVFGKEAEAEIERLNFPLRGN